MKSLILIFTLTLFTSQAFCQKKKDNTIIIDTTISFANLRMILFQNGYNVASSYSVFISTEPTQKEGIMMLKLNMVKTDTTIILKGQLKLLAEGNLFGFTVKEDFEEIYWIKENVMSAGAPMITGWRELDKIAKILGSKREYIKQ